MGPGAGGRGLMVSDSARARAIEVLKAKEKELVTKVTSWAPHICDEMMRRQDMTVGPAWRRRDGWKNLS